MLHNIEPVSTTVTF